MAVIVDAKLRLDVKDAKRQIEQALGAQQANSLKLDTNDLSRQIRDLRQTINKEFSKINLSVPTKKEDLGLQAFEKEFGSSLSIAIEEGFKVLDNIKFSPSKGIFGNILAVFSGLSQPLLAILTGALEGIGRDITEGTGRQLVRGLQAEVAPVVGDFSDIGRSIGREIGQGALLALEGRLEDTAQVFRDVFGEEQVSLGGAQVRFLEAEDAANRYKNALTQLNNETQNISRNKGFLQGQLQQIEQFRAFIQATEKDLDKAINRQLELRGVPKLEEQLLGVDDALESIGREIDQLQQANFGVTNQLFDPKLTEAQRAALEKTNSEQEQQLARLIGSQKQLSQQQDTYKKRIDSVTQSVTRGFSQQINTINILQGELERLDFQFKTVVGRVGELDNAINFGQQGNLLPGIGQLNQLQQSIQGAVTSDVFQSAQIEQAEDQLNRAIGESEALRRKAIEQFNRRSQELKGLLTPELSTDGARQLKEFYERIKADTTQILSGIDTKLKQDFLAIKQNFFKFEQQVGQIASDSQRLVFPSSQAQPRTQAQAQSPAKKIASDLNASGIEALRKRNEAAQKKEFDETNRAILIYRKIVNEAVKASGLDPKDVQNLIPDLNAPKTLLEEIRSDQAGAAGTFNHALNQIKLSRKLFTQLMEGTIDVDLIETIIHELRHGLQQGFSGDIRNTVLGRLKKLSELEGLSDQSRQALERRIAGSAANQPENIRSAKLALEEDAYTFAEQFRDRIFGSVKDYVQQLDRQVLSLGQDSNIEQLRQQALQELTRSKESAAKFIGGTTFSRKGLAQVVKSLDIAPDLVSKGKKAELAEAILAESLQGRAEEISQIIAEYGDQIRNVAGKTGVAGVRGQRTERLASEINDVKASLKFLFDSVEDLPNEISAETAPILDRFTSKVLTVAKEVKEVSGNVNISPEAAKSFGGIKAQIVKIVDLVQSKTGEGIQQNFREVIQSLQRFQDGINRQTLGAVPTVEADILPFPPKPIQVEIPAAVVDPLEEELRRLEREIEQDIKFDTAEGESDELLNRLKAAGALESEVDFAFEDFGKQITDIFGAVTDFVKRQTKTIRQTEEEVRSQQSRIEADINGEAQNINSRARSIENDINITSQVPRTSPGRRGLGPEERFINAETNINQLLNRFNFAAQQIENRAVEAEIGVNAALDGIGENSADNLVKRIQRIYKAFSDGGSGGSGPFKVFANGIKLAAGALGAFLTIRLFNLDALFDRLRELGRQAIQDAVLFEQLETSISFTATTAREGAESFQFVQEEARRLRVGLVSAAKGFQELSASAQGNAELQANVENTTTAILQASRALNLSADQQGRAITALSQIAAKGKVSQEELRGQLSEAVPNALQVAARAFGLTTQELNALVEEGLDATTFLDKFSTQLRRETFVGAAKSANTLGAAIEDIKNQAFLARKELGEEFAGTFRASLSILATALGFVADNAEIIVTTLRAGVFVALTAIASLAARFLPTAIGLVTSLAAKLGIVSFLVKQIKVESNDLTPNFTKLGLTAQGIGQQFSRLKTIAGEALQSINQALGAFARNPGLLVDKLKLDFEALRGSIRNLPQTLKRLGESFATNFRNAGKAIFGVVKSINVLGGAIGTLALQFLVFDGLIKVFNDIRTAGNSFKEINDEILKLEETARKSVLLSGEGDQDFVKASEARRKAFQQELSIYTKGLNFLSELPIVKQLVFGGLEGRSLFQALEDQQFTFNNEAIFQANQALTEYNNLVLQAQEGEISGESLNLALDAAQARLDQLRNVDIIDLDSQQQATLENTIAALEQQITLLQREADIAGNLAGTYGELGKAKRDAVAEAVALETEAIDAIDERLSVESITVEQAEAKKTRARLERIETELAAEKKFLKDLPLDAEEKERDKVEQRINKLTKDQIWNIRRMMREIRIHRNQPLRPIR